MVDVNVPVSAALNPSSVPGQVASAAFAQRFELVISARLTDELSAVLRRPKFAEFVTRDQVDGFTEAVEGAGHPAEDPAEVAPFTRDEDDDYLVALAVVSEADRIVTGDEDLLEADGLPVRVLKPRQFLEELDEP